MFERSLDLSAGFGEYFSRKFVMSLLIALVVTVLAVAFGASLGIHVPESEAEEYWEILDEQVGETTWASIFLNNLSLSLLTLIPFLGIGIMLFIMFNTGFFLGAVSVVIIPADPLTRLLVVLFVTFLFPGIIVAFFEFGAYILLLGEVLYTTYLGLTKSGAKERLRTHFWKTLLIYTAMLLIGALVESVLIAAQQ